MNTNRPFSRGTTLLVLLLTLSAAVFAQTSKKQLTLEWIFGPEGRSVSSLPGTQWLDDGSMIILDNRRPAGERTFEKVDPATGNRQPIVDRSKAIANLKSAGVKGDSL